jgi:hypothetical protein
MVTIWLHGFWMAEGVIQCGDKLVTQLGVRIALRDSEA